MVPQGFAVEALAGLRRAAGPLACLVLSLYRIEETGFKAAVPGSFGRPLGIAKKAKKLLTRKRTGYTLMSAIHKGRLHSAVARSSVVSRITPEPRLIL